MYVCIYICMYVCIYVCMYVKIYVMYVCKYVICLPTEHQGAQRTRSEMPVHSRIELEFGNVGF